MKPPVDAPTSSTRSPRTSIAEPVERGVELLAAAPDEPGRWPRHGDGVAGGDEPGRLLGHGTVHEHAHGRHGLLGLGPAGDEAAADELGVETSAGGHSGGRRRRLLLGGGSRPSSPAPSSPAPSFSPAPSWPWPSSPAPSSPAPSSPAPSSPAPSWPWPSWPWTSWPAPSSSPARRRRVDSPGRPTPSTWASTSSTRSARRPSCLATSFCTSSASAAAASRPRSINRWTAASASDRRTSPALTRLCTTDSACWRDTSVNCAPVSINVWRGFLAIGTG